VDLEADQVDGWLLTDLRAHWPKSACNAIKRASRSSCVICALRQLNLLWRMRAGRFNEDDDADVFAFS
jgi:hypothetical protein